MALIYPLKVLNVIKETKDSVSLSFEIAPEYREIFQYKPAQFLTFHLHINGKLYLRSYSISSCPLLKEPLKTTIKRVGTGLVSNYIIDNVQIEDTIMSRKPAGKFFKPPKDLNPRHYWLFAGGSGITPLFSIIKTILLSDKENLVTLFYANRNEDSIIYKKELTEWSTRYHSRFFIIHTLSRPHQSWNQATGRLNQLYLENFFKAWSFKCSKTDFITNNNQTKGTCFVYETSKKIPSVKLPLFKHTQQQTGEKNAITYFNSMFYLCGPSAFMEVVENFLKKKGIPKQIIKKESFSSSPVKKPTSTATTNMNTVRNKGVSEKGLTKTDMPGKVNFTSLKTSSSSISENSRTYEIHRSQQFSEKPNVTTKVQEVSLDNNKSQNDNNSSITVLGVDNDSHQEASPVETIKALISGELIEIPAQSNIPILEQLLSAGYNPPFSCLSGSCMSCLAVLKKGRIVQEERGILEDENIENHEILTCQAQPRSKLVEVDYDNF